MAGAGADVASEGRLDAIQLDAIQGKGTDRAAARVPGSSYRDLPRRPGAHPGLLIHQGDVLRTYAAGHTSTPDLALELPTGTGKTLPDLVIAEWVRRVRSARVAYACPTIQLTRQVAVTADREGVPAVVLVRSHREWPVPDESRYEAAEAIAITTCSTVFNSCPKLAQPDLILFDDAHAGSHYVAEQYAVDISRQAMPEEYDEILTALSPVLDGMLVQRLAPLSPTGASPTLKIGARRSATTSTRRCTACRPPTTSRAITDPEGFDADSGEWPKGLRQAA